MSIETVRKVFDSIKGVKSHSGKFTGYVDGVLFLESTFLLFHYTNTDYLIIGDNDNKNWIAFSVPGDLVGIGPHVVPFHKGGLVWQVMINGTSLSNVESGSVTVTFHGSDAHRTGVKGTVDLGLSEGRKVTGDFDIKKN